MEGQQQSECSTVLSVHANDSKKSEDLNWNRTIKNNDTGSITLTYVTSGQESFTMQWQCCPRSVTVQAAAFKQGTTDPDCCALPLGGRRYLVSSPFGCF